MFGCLFGFSDVIPVGGTFVALSSSSAMDGDGFSAGSFGNLSDFGDVD
jgi:hypothetical protein